MTIQVDPSTKQDIEINLSSMPHVAVGVNMKQDACSNWGVKPQELDARQPLLFLQLDQNPPQHAFLQHDQTPPPSSQT